MGAAPLAASAVEGLGVLAYAGLVYLTLRMAARWADRALEASVAATPVDPAAPADSPSPKGERA